MQTEILLFELLKVLLTLNKNEREHDFLNWILYEPI